MTQPFQFSSVGRATRGLFCFLKNMIFPLRAGDEERLHSAPVVLHGGVSAQLSAAAEFVNLPLALPSPLPIGAGESASTPSGSDPLQSEEVHSVVNSNFGAAQEVAQPAAQFADQSFAQPETSSEPPR